MKLGYRTALSGLTFALLLPGPFAEARLLESRPPPTTKSHPAHEHGRWSTKEHRKLEKRWKANHPKSRKIERKWRCPGKCSREEA